MAHKCTLDLANNPCPDLRPGQICVREGYCSMKDPDEFERSAPEPERREARWYEKFYEGKSRRI